MAARVSDPATVTDTSRNFLQPAVTPWRKGADGWMNWWFAPVPPHVYALLRITLGIAGCFIFLTRSDVSALWDPTGLVRTDAGASALKQWLVANGLGGLAGGALYAGSLAILVAMTVGIWSRVTVPMAFAVAVVQVRWNPLPTTGADNVLRALLFCLMWVDTGAVWSLDARRRRRSEPSRADLAGAPSSPPPRSVIAPLRLMRFQIALVYLSAGLHKLDNLAWRDGSAVHYVLSSNVHQRVPYFIPPGLEWLPTTATYITLLWELTFAILVLVPAGRVIALVAGILVHLGMFVFMEVGPFHLVMLASYPAFLSPRTVEALGRRLGLAAPPRAEEAALAKS